MHLNNNMLNLNTTTVESQAKSHVKGRPQENGDTFGAMLKNETVKVAEKESANVVDQTNDEADDVALSIYDLSKESLVEMERNLASLLEGVEDPIEIQSIFEEFVSDLPQEVQIRLADFVEAEFEVITSSQLQQSVGILPRSVNQLNERVGDSPKIVFKEAKERAGEAATVPVSQTASNRNEAPMAPGVELEGSEEILVGSRDASQASAKGDAVVGSERGSVMQTQSASTKVETASSASFSEKLAAQQLDSKSQAAVEVMKESAWGKSVGQRAIMMAQYGPRTIEIQLDPPELGTLQVRINLAQNDQINLQFSSPNAGVREALESHQVRLREMFDAAGVKLANTDVSDGRKDGNGEPKTFGRQGGNSSNSQDEKAFVEVNKPVGLVDFYA